MRLNAEGRELIEALLDDYKAEASRKDAAKAIRRFVKVPLTKNQYAAVLGFILSNGIDDFRKSKLLKLLNASKKDWRNMAKAADQFEFYIYSIDEHGRRRPDPYLIEYREWQKALFLLPERVK